MGREEQLETRQTLGDKAIRAAKLAGEVLVAVLPVGCSTLREPPLHYFTISPEDKKKQLPAESVPARIAAIDELSRAAKYFNDYEKSLAAEVKKSGGDAKTFFTKNPNALTQLYNQVDWLERSLSNAQNKPELSGLKVDLSSLRNEVFTFRGLANVEQFDKGTWSSKNAGESKGEQLASQLARGLSSLDTKLTNDRSFFEKITTTYSAARRVLPALESIEQALAPNVDDSYWAAQQEKKNDLIADVTLAIATLTLMGKNNDPVLGWGEPSSIITNLTKVQDSLSLSDKTTKAWRKPTGYAQDPDNIEWEIKYAAAQAFDSLKNIGQKLESRMDQYAPGRDVDPENDGRGGAHSGGYTQYHYWGRSWNYPADQEYHNSGVASGFSRGGTRKSGAFSGGSGSSSFSGGHSGGFSGGSRSGGFGGRGFGAGG